MKTHSDIGLMFVVGLAMAACGAPDDRAEMGESSAATTSTAVEASSDAPVASAVQVQHTNGAQLWVFACDRNNRLMRDVRSSPTARFWNTPEVLTSDCASPPAVEPDGPSSTAVVWVRTTANHLVSYAIDASGIYAQTDVSTISGVGPISGIPVPLGRRDNVVQGTGGWMTVAVRTDRNHLYMVKQRYFPTSAPQWSYAAVLTQLGAAVRTTNTFNALAYNGGLVPYYARPLTGRGTGANDDDMCWIAEPADPTDPSSTYTIGLSYAGCSGTPTFNTNRTDRINPVVVVPSFVSDPTRPMLSWYNTPFPDNDNINVLCQTVAGSPNGSGTVGYVRSPHAELLKYDADISSCVSVGGSVVSAPNIVQQVTSNVLFGFENDAFYKASDGNLHYYDSRANNHTFLPIQLP